MSKVSVCVAHGQAVGQVVVDPQDTIVGSDRLLAGFGRRLLTGPPQTSLHTLGE